MTIMLQTPASHGDAYAINGYPLLLLFALHFWSSFLLDLSSSLTYTLFIYRIYIYLSLFHACDFRFYFSRLYKIKVNLYFFSLSVFSFALICYIYPFPSNFLFCIFVYYSVLFSYEVTCVIHLDFLSLFYL